MPELQFNTRMPFLFITSTFHWDLTDSYSFWFVCIINILQKFNVIIKQHCKNIMNKIKFKNERFLLSAGDDSPSKNKL